MSGRELIHDLGLDWGRVEHDRDLHLNLAQADGVVGDPEQASQLTSRPAQYLQLTRQATVASCYRRAGSSSLLLGELDQAKFCFDQAAKRYAELGLPYGRVMASMSSRQDREFVYADSGLDKQLGMPPQAWLELFRKGYGQSERPERFHDEEIRLMRDEQASTAPVYPEPLLRQMQYPAVEAGIAPHNGDSGKAWLGVVDQLRRARGSPVGILGLPMAYYVFLLDALHPSVGHHDATEQIHVALLPFALAFQEALLTAMTHSYHWKRLAMPFHPAEPDILGVFRMVANGHHEVASRIKLLPLDARVRALLLAALEP